jgi:ribosomal protein L32
MTEFSRMPRYDIRNDGIGPYAVFYCETCEREYRSQPDVAATLKQDISKDVAGGLLRKVPLFGGAIANNVVGEDPRYSYKMTPEQLNKAWQQVQVQFRECPTCLRIVCLSDFDTQTGFCNSDSPRQSQIAESQGEQAGAAIKGLASAFGLGDVMKNVQQAAKTAQNAAAQAARCPNDGTLAAPGTRFCPECGTAMIQPAADKCPNCGQETHGAKFCPNCGTKIEPAVKAGFCPNCGAETKDAKFCPECGTKIG